MEMEIIGTNPLAELHFRHFSAIVIFKFLQALIQLYVK